MQVSRVSKVEFGKSHVVEYRYKVFGLFPRNPYHNSSW